MGVAVRALGEGIGAVSLVLPFPVAGLLSGFLKLEPWTGLTWGFAVAAVLNWFWGRWVNQKGMLDRITGARAKHRICGMPMQWFSVVLFCLFLICLIAPAVGA